MNELRRIGIHPDIVVCRSTEPLSDDIREKIALFADVDRRAVVAAPDVPDVYMIPEVLQAEGLDALVCEKLGIETGPAELGEWRELTERSRELDDEVEIALVGKYVKLHDAYLSVHEALKHAGVHHGARVRVRWVDAEHMSYEETVRELEQVDGVLVPGGFGSRGWEGKILACRAAREREIPYLGICLGMHVAVSEFARHVAGMDGANSTEMDPETPFPVIDLLPEQKEIEDLGGTMRLGAQAVELAEGTRALETYGEPVVHERHRHRYEVNNELRPRLLEAGLVVSGTFQDGRLVEVVELPDHPWFVAQPVPSGVQVTPHSPLAALPRLRGCGARTSPRAFERRAARRGIASGPHGLYAGLLDHFLELCAIPSPSGRERSVADRVGAYLTELGLDWDEDDAAAKLEGDTGNIYCSVPATSGSGTPIFLCAHTDTVPPEAAIEPLVEDGVVRNAARTILGSDNKAAVVVMLEATTADPRGCATACGYRARLHAAGGGFARGAPLRSTRRASSRERGSSTTRARRSARSCSAHHTVACSTFASTDARHMRG